MQKCKNMGGKVAEDRVHLKSSTFSRSKLNSAVRVRTKLKNDQSYEIAAYTE